MTNGIDRSDHGTGDRISVDILDEGAINLQKIHRQILQVGKGRQPRTEIIEGKITANRLQPLHENHRSAQVGNGTGLGNFKADALRRHAMSLKGIENKLEEAFLTEAGCREID